MLGGKKPSFETALIIWLVTALSACSSPYAQTMTQGADAKTRSFSFEEEVKLSGGSVITVNRTITQRRICEGMRCSWGRLRERISFRDDVGKEVVWEEQLGPFLLDADPTLGWLVVGRAGYAGEQQKYNAERNPYVVFVLESNNWKRIDLADALIGRDTNILIEVNQDSGEPKKVTLANKQERNSDRYLPESAKKIAPDAFRKGR
jgi:hypothetical protein